MAMLCRQPTMLNQANFRCKSNPLHRHLKLAWLSSVGCLHGRYHTVICSNTALYIVLNESSCSGMCMLRRQPTLLGARISSARSMPCCLTLHSVGRNPAKLNTLSKVTCLLLSRRAAYCCCTLPQCIGPFCFCSSFSAVIQALCGVGWSGE